MDSSVTQKQLLSGHRLIVTKKHICLSTEKFFLAQSLFLEVLFDYPIYKTMKVPIFVIISLNMLMILFHKTHKKHSLCNL